MPEERKTSSPPERGRSAPAPVDLHAAVTSLVTAVLAGRVALDRETARLAAMYQDNQVLSQFPVPAFGIAEVTLSLPYAAVDLKQGREKVTAADLSGLAHMLVQVNAEALAQLPPHAVATVEVKLTQQQLTLLLEQQG